MLFCNKLLIMKRFLPGAFKAHIKSIQILNSADEDDLEYYYGLLLQGNKGIEIINPKQPSKDFRAEEALNYPAISL